MPERWIRPSCIGALVAAWIVDLVTPQMFVVAIILDAPIALSSLALDSRFTRFLVVLAVLADVSAGWVDGLHDGRFDPVALANRAIVGLSYLLVGSLSIATQGLAARAGELAARQERAARERGVRRAVASVRASVNPELVRRAIVREARASLGVDGAVLYAFEPSLDEPSTYGAAAADGDVELGTERPPAEILSLLHRMADQREEIVEVLDTDALGRLRLETFGARSAIAASLVEHETTYGVLVLVRRTSDFEPHFEEGLSLFVDQAAIALAQARLFTQLGERNDELAGANIALRERGDVIRDIVYALSHDLRTPLAAAAMTLQQALDGAYGPLPQAYRDILARSIASNDELRRLAETLLLVSQYESGDRKPRTEPVDLAAVAESVVHELEPLWRSKLVDVRYDARGRPSVAGDERELRRAVVNLLANAVTWTPANGSIEVRVERDAAGAVIRVEDAGYGVPERERADLFERVRDATSRRGSGMGLGLYLVRRIAESHGGTVRYAPRPGGGSIFALHLPVLAPAALPSGVAG